MIKSDPIRPAIRRPRAPLMVARRRRGAAARQPSISLAYARPPGGVFGAGGAVPIGGRRDLCPGRSGASSSRSGRSAASPVSATPCRRPAQAPTC